MKRLFIAIKIPVQNNFKETLKHFKQTFKTDNIKWVDPNNLHLTLIFLGDTEEELIPEIIQNLNKLQDKFKSFKIILKKLGVFNNVKYPKVLWIGVEPRENLNSLKELISERLFEFDLSYKDNREFKPHLTIARPKQINNINKLKNLLYENKNTVFQEQNVYEFALYESKLTPEGPIYTTLSKISLR